MSSETPIVHVVDDDPAVLAGISSLIRSTGLHVATYGSAEAFLARELEDRPACLVLDVRLPGASGLDLQRSLRGQAALPIIFITGHGDIPMSVRAMKEGAVEFLPKPFDDDTLLVAIAAAIERDRAGRGKRAEDGELKARFALLTAREREVAVRVVRGLLNKQIAAELGIQEITVKVHRRHLMEKLGLRSVTDLVRAAERVGLTAQDYTKD